MRPVSVFRPPPRVPVPQCMLAWGLPPGSNAGRPLRVVRVKGDGRCLYRSIARSLAHEEQRSLPPRLETEDADALRSLAWKEMCVERAAEYSRRNIVEGSLRAYCAQMRNTSFFAGEAEILALSDALNLPISVFLDTGHGKLKSIATYGDKYKKKAKGKVIKIVYNGNNHYNAVVTR